MALDYKHQIHIGSRDVDGNGVCRPSALLGHLQDAATLAAQHGGFGRDELIKECDGFWMLARMWYQLKQPLRWDEHITVHTWHRGAKAALMYRDYDIYAGEEHVGEGVSGWVLVDMKTRKLLRLRHLNALANTDGGALCKTKTLGKVNMPKEMTLNERRKMRYSDTDINGHVNNTRYADFACDAFELEKLPRNQFLSSMQLRYTAECLAGEEIALLTGQEEGACYVLGKDDGGADRFEIRMTIDNMP